MDETRIVRTRGHTRFAANADFVIDQYDAAKVMDMTRTCRTAIDAWWRIALVAPFGADFHME
jgi:hypothetical protein